MIEHELAIESLNRVLQDVEAARPVADADARPDQLQVVIDAHADVAVGTACLPGRGGVDRHKLRPVQPGQIE